MIDNLRHPNELHANVNSVRHSNDLNINIRIYNVRHCTCSYSVPIDARLDNSVNQLVSPVRTTQVPLCV